MARRVGRSRPVTHHLRYGRPVAPLREGDDPIVDDAAREASIRRYGALDGAPRVEVLAIAELAAQITGMPMAAVNIMTADQQHTIATVGFDSDVCRRDDSMCAAVLTEKSPVVVPDASLDPRFRDNPFVTGQIGQVRFYASHRLVDRDGVVIGTLCVFDDEPRMLDDREARALGVLAERIVDVLELSLRGRQLEASNDRLTHFAGRVSHDLKTPLTSISMTLQLIQEQLDERDDTDQTGWLIEKALKGSDRMASMIDGILAYATAGGSVERAPVALGAVTADALADLRSELAGVQTSVLDLPTVLGDEVQLRTLMQNLLANSAKYRDPDRPLRIGVDAEQGDRTWRIRVTDNGIGIPPEQRGRVFQRGVRLDAAQEGSGIGLDTARGVVEGHGGTIGIEAADGGGTVVWFELPF